MARFSSDKKPGRAKPRPQTPFLYNRPTLSAGSRLMRADFKEDDFLNSEVMGHVKNSTLLIPALVLVPSLSGKDEISKKYTKLKGEDKNLMLAAAHIEDAKTGSGEYGKAKYYFKPRHAQIAFNIYTNPWFIRLLFFVVLLHSTMTFIEPPSKPSDYLEAQIPAICIDFLCLLMYMLDVAMILDFLPCKAFWTSDGYFWNRVEFVFLCFFFVDWILLIVQVIGEFDEIIQPFRALRLAMVLCKARNLGHIYLVVQSIVFKLGGVVMIFLIFVLIYSCIGVHLLMRPFEVIGDLNISVFRPDRDVDIDTVLAMSSPVTSISGLTNITADELSLVADICAVASESAFNESSIYEGTFDNIGPASYQLFILLTTENFPVFMFPAFQQSQWYFLYFGSFLTVGVFFLTAILLAIIANIYWEYNKKHVKKELKKQRDQLVKSWRILDTVGNERIPVDDPRFLKLFRILKPKNSDEENKELLKELDPEDTQYVDWIQWISRLLDILDFEKADAMHRYSPSCKCCDNSCIRFIMKMTRKLIRKRASEIFFLLLIMIHSILFTLKWQGMHLQTEFIIQGIRSGMIVIFLIEMFLRFVAYGSAFFVLFNIIDLGLVVVGLLSNALWYVTLLEFESDRLDVELWRGATVVISSMAIFFRLFFNSAKSRGVMSVFLKLFPIMGQLLVLFGIVLYLYAVIGMEAFNKLEISDDTPSADFFQYNCGLGFRDFRCSLYIMFQLLTTSNWHDIMNSMILTLDTFAPLIYFISFYIVVNLVIMNLLVAIGLEAFNKFSQEQVEQEKERDGVEDHAEEEKKTKITGRFLIREAIDLLADSLAATNEMNDLSRNFYDDDEEEEEEEGRVGDEEAGTSHKRTLSAPPVKPKGGTILRVRPRSSVTRVGSDPQLVVPQRSQTLQAQPVPKQQFLSAPMDEAVVVPKYVIPVGSTQRSPTSVVMVEPDIDVVTSPVVTSPLLISSSGAKSDKESLLSKAADDYTRGQRLLRKKLNEGQRSKGSVKTSRKSISVPPLAKSDSASSTLVPSQNKARRLSMIPQLGTNLGINVKAVPAVNDPADKQQVESKKITTGSGPGPKFRKAYHGDNWRRDVQEITILNQDEISEVRKQLVAKPLPKKDLANVRRQSKAMSKETLEIERPKQKTSSLLSISQESTGVSDDRQKKIDSVFSEQNTGHSLADIKLTMDSFSDRESSAGSRVINDALLINQPKTKTPAFPGAVRAPPSSASPSQFPPIAVKKTRQHHAKRQAKKKAKAKTQLQGEDAPDWLVELTKKHNVSLSQPK